MFFVALLSLIICPAVAQAHVIEGTGLMSGLAHPLTGLDHLLAMVAVGIIGARASTRAMFLIPAIFLGSMFIGICCGPMTILPQIVEIGICSSLLVFGIIIYFNQSIPLVFMASTVAFFAFFHGHSHGEELLIVQNAIPYYFGLIMSTAFLHFSGVTLGVFSRKHLGLQTALHYSGGGMCVTGLYLMIPYLGS